jgi:hypothetical protein
MPLDGEKQRTRELIGLLNALRREKIDFKGIEKGSQCPWKRKNKLHGH